MNNATKKVSLINFQFRSGSSSITEDHLVILLFPSDLRHVVSLSPCFRVVSLHLDTYFCLSCS